MEEEIFCHEFLTSTPVQPLAGLFLLYEDQRHPTPVQPLPLFNPWRGCFYYSKINAILPLCNPWRGHRRLINLFLFHPYEARPGPTGLHPYRAHFEYETTIYQHTAPTERGPASRDRKQECSQNPGRAILFILFNRAYPVQSPTGTRCLSCSRY